MAETYSLRQDWAIPDALLATATPRGAASNALVGWSDLVPTPLGRNSAP